MQEHQPNFHTGLSTRLCLWNYRWVEQWQWDPSPKLLIGLSFLQYRALQLQCHSFSVPSWRTCEGLQLQVSFKNQLCNIHINVCCNCFQIHFSAALQLLPGWFIKELVQIKTSSHYLNIINTRSTVWVGLLREHQKAPGRAPIGQSDSPLRSCRRWGCPPSGACRPMCTLSASGDECPPPWASAADQPPSRRPWWSCQSPCGLGNNKAKMWGQIVAARGICSTTQAAPEM